MGGDEHPSAGQHPPAYLTASTCQRARHSSCALGPGGFLLPANRSPDRRTPTMADRLIIFDTTLRDGEQAPGISLDVAEKLEIAEQLARLGVDIIEAGFPIASIGDFEAVEAVAKAVRGPVITALSRTGFQDVDRAWEAVRHAEKPRIHVFIATSKIHMEKKLRMTPDQVKQ